MQTLIFFRKLQRADSWSEVVRLISRAFFCSLEIRHTNTSSVAYLQSLSCNHRAHTASMLAVNTLKEDFYRRLQFVSCNKVFCILESSSMNCSVAPPSHHHHTRVSSIILILSIRSCLTLREVNPWTGIKIWPDNRPKVRIAADLSSNSSTLSVGVMAYCSDWNFDWMYAELPCCLLIM